VPGQYRYDRQHFGRKEHLLDQVATGDEYSGRLEQRRGEPGPREDSAEHEQRERLKLSGVGTRQDDGENECIDEEEEKRMDVRPEETEYRPSVARLQVAGHEAGHQAAVSDDVSEA
jgi:hypothetical protein